MDTENTDDDLSARGNGLIAEKDFYTKQEITNLLNVLSDRLKGLAED